MSKRLSDKGLLSHAVETESRRLILGIGVLALTALLNPYTLFGRDTGAYWASAFLLPIVLASGPVLWRIWRRRHEPKDNGANSRFINEAFAVQVVVLILQWADV